MDINYPVCKPEIWGGIECTINRVGDQFRDQLEYSGHYSRPGDIAAIASLGVTTLRYPILWERHQPSEQEPIDWQWATSQVNEINSRGIKIIAGLLHHGSGPAFTSLHDPAFPEKFARYAAAVATQFPEIEMYTPVNEPNTTARFSGLYGHWYPHFKSNRQYCFMLLNQLKATVLAMQAIRKINPAAKLVQTEDLSKTHSTPALKYQADFENERRWITFDVLNGKLNRRHPLWKFFIKHGISISLLQFFLDNPMPPDTMGFNYYVTSERYLDDQVEHYPAFLRGGNKRNAYVDVEAARITKICGLSSLLQEAWNRYHVEIAVTEVHLNCSREDQLRWLKESWDGCCKLIDKGVKVKAITGWALLGAFDWCSLLTCYNGRYEPGAFSLYNNELRPTAVATMLRSLAKEKEYIHPLLNNHGWWHRENRLLPHLGLADTRPPRPGAGKVKQTLLILGKEGPLLDQLERSCKLRAIDCTIARNAKDTWKILEQGINDLQPWSVVDATGCLSPHPNHQGTFQTHIANVEAIAKRCFDNQIPLLTFTGRPAVNATGNGSKAAVAGGALVPFCSDRDYWTECEQRLVSANPDILVVPIDLVPSRAKQPLGNLLADTPVVAFSSPWEDALPIRINEALDLLIDREKGVWVSIPVTESTGDANFEEAEAWQPGNETPVEATSFNAAVAV